ncbi:MAG: hypothetical protein QW699_06130 [Metallosphaera sp.]|uniref:hypothetical protein n=1 Tax=Metallosphaera sp. TaxID=2020860 RepID=UPI003161F85A
MSVVIGAGITGLIAALNREAVVVEEQTEIGGLYSTDKIGDLEFTILPPIIEREKEIIEVFPQAQIEELSAKIQIIENEHLPSKICNTCSSFPRWLIPSKLLVVRNFPELFEKIKGKIKIVRGYPIKIVNDKLFTNRGVYSFKELINTGSRRRLNKTLGIEEKLDYYGCLIIQILLKNRITDWDIQINGKSEITFSHIINVENSPLYYVYSFHSKKQLPDSERVVQDLKRSKIISQDDILSIRTKYINECILSGEKNYQRPNFLKECGRLGSWANLSLNEAIRSALEC